MVDAAPALPLLLILLGRLLAGRRRWRPLLQLRQMELLRRRPVLRLRGGRRIALLLELLLLPLLLLTLLEHLPLLLLLLELLLLDLLLALLILLLLLQALLILLLAPELLLLLKL